MAARARVLGLGFGLFLALAGTAASREEAWKVAVRGQDVTRAADPRLSGGALLVDAVALGPSLPLRVRAAGREVTVLDASGLEWRGTAGDLFLSSPGRSLTLDRPIRIEGPSVYLPAGIVAELAGLRLDVDAGARTAAFAGRGEQAPAPAGWQGLSLPKPADPASRNAPPPRPRREVFLPPDHDTLRVGLGLGAVPGADGGGELTAAGSVRGIDTALSLLATTGPRGFELQSGHAALTDPDRGLGLEAGDLFSGIWGLARGTRLRWRRGEEGASWPALSVYLADPGVANPQTVITYGDEIGLGRWGTAAGELASDGSWLASGRFHRYRLSLFGYLRDASGRFGAGRGAGISGTLGLPRGLELQGAFSRDGSGDQRLADRTLSLRVPLRPGSALTLAADRSAVGRSRSRTDSVEGTTAVGPLQLRGRWQRRELRFPGLFGTTLRFAEQDAFVSASVLAGSRLRIEAQLVARWPEQGERDEWRQVSASLALTRRTSLQVFATSSSSGFGNSLRVRLDQELRPGYSLFVEAGDVVTFQPTLSSGSPDRTRFRVMVRRSWDVATPAPGTGVEGFVDGSGVLATAGLPVELGPYRTVTDGDGRYAFPNVPPGDYDLRLREQELPADATAGPPSRVRVKRGESRRADLSVVPLGQARGWVYVDRNGNHRRDPGEGIAGVALVLDDHATGTAPDGAFAFFNLPPGSHRIHIETGRLPAGLQALIPTRMDLGLPAGQSIDGLEFRLQENQKPVVFQEAGR